MPTPQAINAPTANQAAAQSVKLQEIGLFEADTKAIVWGQQQKAIQVMEESEHLHCYSLLTGNAGL